MFNDNVEIEKLNSLDFNNNANKRDECFLVKSYEIFQLYTKVFVYLRFLCGDGGISVNQFCEHASKSLNTQRQRSDVQQKDISYVSCQNSSL